MSKAPPKRVPSALVLLAALALIVVACGGSKGDTASDGGRELDRCSLITTSEAEQWLGGGVTAAPTDGIDGKPDLVTCLYESGEGSQVLIQVYDGAVYFAKEGSASRSGETIEGLGEDAFMGNRAVRFLQNDWAASVAQIIGPVSDEALLEMAQLMSSRLP